MEKTIGNLNQLAKNKGFDNWLEYHKYLEKKRRNKIKMDENIRYGIGLLFKDEIKKENKEKKDLAKREKKCIKPSIKGFDKYMFNVLIRSYKYIIIYTDENIDIAESIPDGCGIYLFNTDLGHYIGSSLNIKERIKEHRYEHNIKSVNVYLMDKLPDARMIEKQLIERCRPELNKLK